MYCTKCGKEIDDQAIICTGCGVATSNYQPAQSQPATTPPPIIINNTNTNTNTNTIGFSYIQKSKWAAFFLCLLLGIFGAHRFYTGKIGTGIIYLLTAGLGGIGVLFDLVMILIGAFRDKAGQPLK